MDLCEKLMTADGKDLFAVLCGENIDWLGCRWKQMMCTVSTTYTRLRPSSVQNDTSQKWYKSMDGVRQYKITLR